MFQKNDNISRLNISIWTQWKYVWTKFSAKYTLLKVFPRASFFACVSTCLALIDSAKHAFCDCFSVISWKKVILRQLFRLQISTLNQQVTPFWKEERRGYHLELEISLYDVKWCHFGCDLTDVIICDVITSWSHKWFDRCHMKFSWKCLPGIVILSSFTWTTYTNSSMRWVFKMTLDEGGRLSGAPEIHSPTKY